MVLGKKIVIVGISASGKSTFARKLAAKIGVTPYFIDALMWKPGWVYIGDEETTKKLSEITAQPEWLIEGYVAKSARTFVFERADAIIYLDYSPLVSSLRYILRSWKHRKDPRSELQGSPDKFSFKFLKLVWTKGEAISLNESLKQVANQEKIVVLKSPRQARSFLK
jgi:adenylate kinase family enzyme